MVARSVTGLESESGGLAAEVCERAHGLVHESIGMGERRELVGARPQGLDSKARDRVNLAVHDEVESVLDHPERDDLAAFLARRADCKLSLSFSLSPQEGKLSGLAHSAAFSAACAIVSRSA